MAEELVEGPIIMIDDLVPLFHYRSDEVFAVRNFGSGQVDTDLLKYLNGLSVIRRYQIGNVLLLFLTQRL